MHIRVIAGIFLFGGMGTLCRVGLQNLFADFRFSESFILLIIQLLGSLFIGILASLIKNPVWKLTWTTGFCGGLTTMSSFSMQLLTLLQSEGWPIFLAYAWLNVFGSVLCCLFGMWISKKFRR